MAIMRSTAKPSTKVETGNDSSGILDNIDSEMKVKNDDRQLKDAKPTYQLGNYDGGFPPKA